MAHIGIQIDSKGKLSFRQYREAQAGVEHDDGFVSFNTNRYAQSIEAEKAKKKTKNTNKNCPSSSVAQDIENEQLFPPSHYGST